MSDKGIEKNKVIPLYEAGQYEGAAATTYGKVIDTSGYGDATIVLNVGSLIQNSTLTALVVENSTQDPTTAVAVTDASFGTLTSSTDMTCYLASVKDKKRYLWLKATTAGAPTINFGAVAVLSNPRSEPISQTVTFDV